MNLISAPDHSGTPGHINISKHKPELFSQALIIWQKQPESHLVYRKFGKSRTCGERLDALRLCWVVQLWNAGAVDHVHVHPHRQLEVTLTLRLEKIVWKVFISFSSYTRNLSKLKTHLWRQPPLHQHQCVPMNDLCLFQRCILGDTSKQGSVIWNHCKLR